jgi:hypothetical protein
MERKIDGLTVRAGRALALVAKGGQQTLAPGSAARIELLDAGMVERTSIRDVVKLTVTGREWLEYNYADLVQAMGAK